MTDSQHNSFVVYTPTLYRYSWYLKMNHIKAAAESYDEALIIVDVSVDGAQSTPDHLQALLMASTKLFRSTHPTYSI